VATLKKYNLSGKEVGSVQIDDAFLDIDANSQMIKDYIVAIRNNARQWSASTKTRAEVAHTTAKPRPQKGSGRARTGSLVSPQYRGGGRVHTPRPKFDQHVKINKKEKKAAIRFLIAEKIKSNNLVVIDGKPLEEPKTKTITSFFKSRSLGKRVLVLGESNFVEIEQGDTKQKVTVGNDKHTNMIKSLRNLPKVQFSLASNVNGYDLLVANDIVLTEAALKEVTEWLS
jgi:large subunit ribosomal protein L4